MVFELVRTPVYIVRGTEAEEPEVNPDAVNVSSKRPPRLLNKYFEMSANLPGDIKEIFEACANNRQQQT